jgi:hypothetical protein
MRYARSSREDSRVEAAVAVVKGDEDGVLGQRLFAEARGFHIVERNCRPPIGAQPFEKADEVVHGHCVIIQVAAEIDDVVKSYADEALSASCTPLSSGARLAAM